MPSGLVYSKSDIKKFSEFDRTSFPARARILSKCEYCKVKISISKTKTGTWCIGCSKSICTGARSIS